MPLATTNPRAAVVATGVRTTPAASSTRYTPARASLPPPAAGRQPLRHRAASSRSKTSPVRMMLLPHTRRTTTGTAASRAKTSPITSMTLLPHTRRTTRTAAGAVTETWSTGEIVLGVDIGGSGIKGALVDLRTGKLVTERHRIPTPEGATPKDVCNTVRNAIPHRWQG
jgi:hypothetical protein